MSIASLLLQEFKEEVARTRTTLERIPADQKEFAPHAKSMPVGKLAPHVAQLPEFGLTVITSPGFDVGGRKWTPLAFDSAAQLVEAFDEGAASVSAALEKTADAAWNENWKLSFNGAPIFDGPRFLAYRQMFVNHLVHHRAQLGVYLRLMGKPVPATYGPSADDTMGF